MMKRPITGLILSAVLMATQIGFAAGRTLEPAGTKIEQQIRRALVSLPFYSLFDSFSFRVDGDTVTLIGKVTRPGLKSEAENVVKNIEGVTVVNNKIDVLPLSPFDDQLRWSLYRAIYGHTVLQPLSIRAFPPIHILVENGNVTLEGAVATSLEKTIAGLQANSVLGVFSVTNNLSVENETERAPNRPS